MTREQALAAGFLQAWETGHKAWGFWHPALLSEQEAPGRLDLSMYYVRRLRRRSRGDI